MRFGKERKIVSGRFERTPSNAIFAGLVQGHTMQWKCGATWREKKTTK
jgi:hypothetical protein